MKLKTQITAAHHRLALACTLCPHWDYFAWDEHRLECCRERLAAEREVRRLTRSEIAHLEVAHG